MYSDCPGFFHFEILCCGFSTTKSCYSGKFVVRKLTYSDPLYSFWHILHLFGKLSRCQNSLKSRSIPIRRGWWSDAWVRVHGTATLILAPRFLCSPDSKVSTVAGWDWTQWLPVLPEWKERLGFRFIVLLFQKPWFGAHVHLVKSVVILM